MLFCPLQKIDFKGDALKAFSLGDRSEVADRSEVDIPVFFHSGIKFSADILNKIKLVEPWAWAFIFQYPSLSGLLMGRWASIRTYLLELL